MNAGKLLFISQRINDMASGARVVSTTNLEVARTVFGTDGVVVYSVRKVRRGKISNVARKIFGYLDGFTQSDIDGICARMREGDISAVYIDSSYFGLVAKVISKRFPRAAIITFYHDVLVHWWEETHSCGFLSYAANRAIYRRSERLCAKYSDRNIVMTARDRDMLRDLYGVDEQTIDVIPLSIKGSSATNGSQGDIPRAVSDLPTCAQDRGLLFIGVDYKPNVEGLEWFLKYVQPSLGVSLNIVGKGLENYRTAWETGNVRVIGSVDSLTPWYESSAAVIIPLFSGSGMKVKTAEAFSFGKPVFSTDEGLTGYEVDDVRGVFRCNTADEFIDSIRSWLAENDNVAYLSEVRNLFEKKYSANAAVSAFAKAVESCRTYR